MTVFFRGADFAKKRNGCWGVLLLCLMASSSPGGIRSKIAPPPAPSPARQAEDDGSFNSQEGNRRTRFGRTNTAEEERQEREAAKLQHEKEAKLQEQASTIGYLTQTTWKQEESIEKLGRQMSLNQQIYEEELRLAKDEARTSESTAAHRDRMMRLELTRLSEEVRASHHAHELAVQNSKERFVVEGEAGDLEKWAQHMGGIPATSPAYGWVSPRHGPPYRRYP